MEKIVKGNKTPLTNYSLINSLSVACYDELAVGYQPSSKVKEDANNAGEPIPVMFLPRKPHPNCILIYLLATYLQHPIRQQSCIPFILNILPHLKVDASPQESLRKTME